MHLYADKPCYTAPCPAAAAGDAGSQPPAAARPGPRTQHAQCGGAAPQPAHPPVWGPAGGAQCSPPGRLAGPRATAAAAARAAAATAAAVHGRGGAICSQPPARRAGGAPGFRPPAAQVRAGLLGCSSFVDGAGCHRGSEHLSAWLFVLPSAPPPLEVHDCPPLPALSHCSDPSLAAMLFGMPLPSPKAPIQDAATESCLLPDVSERERGCRGLARCWLRCMHSSRRWLYPG